MLSITNLLKKNKILRIFNKKGNTIRVSRRYIPLSKEWKFSFYAFNKNPMRFLPAVHDYLFKLLKWYFNMVSENMKIGYSNPIKIQRSLGDKVWVSIPEIKYINGKMDITVYVYNRLYNQYKKELSTLELIWDPNIEHSYDNESLNKTVIVKNIKFIKSNKTVHFKSNDFISNQDYYVKVIKLLKLIKHIDIKQYKLDILELIRDNKTNLLKGLNLLSIERYDYLINLFKKELIYIKLKQKILFNELKFKELYLRPLISLLEIVYKKKIGFNIVMLKNYYLSSSILSQIIIAKAISIKNRGRTIHVINDSLETPNVPNLSGNKLPRIDKISIGMQNIILKQFKRVENKQDLLNRLLITNNKSNVWSSKYIDNLALKNLENKSVAGIFIKASGRLTKRFKAQRAVNYLRYRGTLKNVYSAHQGFSSVLSRGYMNINVDKTVMHSKVRTGAFGIKGWVASY